MAGSARNYAVHGFPAYLVPSIFKDSETGAAVTDDLTTQHFEAPTLVTQHGHEADGTPLLRCIRSLLAQSVGQCFRTWGAPLSEGESDMVVMGRNDAHDP
jgi:hypothetical protein